MKKQFIFIFFLLLPFLVFGQLFETGKISPHTAHFLTQLNKENVNDKQKAATLKKQYSLLSVENKNYIRAFIKINENADLSLLEKQGVKINSVISDIITVQIPIDKLETVEIGRASCRERV